MGHSKITAKDLANPFVQHFSDVNGTTRHIG